MSIAWVLTMPDPPRPATRPASRDAPLLAGRDALPVGSRLAEFRILRVLGRGGFGIVYLAHDDTLVREVAIKEYLPAMWAGRGADGQVTVRCSSHAVDFAAGLTSFVNEARLLARFDHPSLVKVHRFWEARGTAYMVMPYHQGVSLRQLRDSMGEPPSEAWLRRLLHSLLGALDVLHQASVLHRDVAPDNILVLPSGIPVLLDFGAARQVLRGQTRALTAILKPSYAPIEQYAGDAETRQGPWTDIYAVAATLHFALTGVAPCSSAARVVHDAQRLLHRREPFRASPAAPAYDRTWLEALDWGLAVMPHARPQNIAQWQEALAGRLSAPRAATADPPPGTVAPGLAAPAPPAAAPGHRATAGSWAARAMVAGVLGVGLWAGPAGFSPRGPAAAFQAVAEAAQADPVAPEPAPAPSPSPSPSPSPPEVALLLPTPAVPNAASAVVAPAAALKTPARSTTLRQPGRRQAPTLTSPVQQCAALGWFARMNCMRKACATRPWTQHPQCTQEERLGRNGAASDGVS